MLNAHIKGVNMLIANSFASEINNEIFERNFRAFSGAVVAKMLQRDFFQQRRSAVGIL